ncbi:adhesive plaque matrix protein-like [Artemia franciscana]|uniref:adhesive plaque matrix protein-like n=1 Tax=Artemia franciscana TaxID=6661 RepID=UPI0032DA19B8
MVKFLILAAIFVTCIAAQYNNRPSYKPSYSKPQHQPSYHQPAYSQPAYQPAYPKPSYNEPSYKPSYGGQVPPLPPFGAAAKHPKYGGGYGGDKYGGEEIYAYRYESTSRGPNAIDSSYAYKVDGQEVQVARQDPHYSKGYSKY